ncbi:calpain-1 catalytic subunit-like [Megalops cyprinoides]|uniref:calpain-1 catalytic subunit-like n=1 Tax=Megalops cyprinoides TaxID=118141 RepID=UPI001863E9A9|nr:calpain-1 catalytic subunit-like [Megalops cyprinoides]
MPPPGVCLNIMKERYRKDGLGTPENPEKFYQQDFEYLRQYFIIRGRTFVDEMFPPDRNSIGPGILSPEEMERVEWIRPTKLVQDPYLIVDGVSRFDFAQGAVGNCWFLASIGALTFQEHILKLVVPLDQGFQEDYAGIFHFKFWRFGKWYDVVIDDKLPTIDGRFIFVHSKTNNEFWPALLEKAYAKVCGSYADMNAGNVSEALMDFTGGVHMTFKLKEAPPDLWELMARAYRSKALMGCGTPQGQTAANTVLPNGIVEGHAYAVTAVYQVTSQGRVVKLVRLWNPWGRGEWNGDWSDKSPWWQTVSVEDRTNLLKIENDGEFWMSMEDYCQNYESMDICCLCPDFLDGSSSCHWASSFHEGRWVAGTTAGGCMNYRDSFWTNPQYRINLHKMSEECAETQGPNNMLVTLMQKPDKRNRRLVSNLHIGFSVFEVPPQFQNQRGKFPASFFYSNPPVAQTKTYLNCREVMEFFRLKPGEYLIVPSTYKPNETASFLLTILGKNETHIEESSSVHHVEITKPTITDNYDGEKKEKLFRQYSDQYEEVDAEQLQRLLNENVLEGSSPETGFSLDACRSIVAMMDLSVTGRLNGPEFIRLWKRVVTYKTIFLQTDVSQTGTLSLSELRNAVEASGIKVSDDILNILALRYGRSSGHITLESFICLILRLDCMAKTFKQMSDGKGIYLRENEWLYLTMYS